jgi:hypothetical protein
MNYRVLLAYPGGELSLFEYKRPVPIQQALSKAASEATTLFKSWQWSKDPETPGIEADNGSMILVVQGPSGKECFL